MLSLLAGCYVGFGFTTCLLVSSKWVDLWLATCLVMVCLCVCRGAGG